MRAVRKNLAKLVRMRKATPAERKELIEAADDSLIHSICECAHNCLNSNVPLTKAQFKRLSQHKKVLRRLAKPGESLKKKKKIVKQCGGFLLPLLAPVLGVLLQSVLQ